MEHIDAHGVRIAYDVLGPSDGGLALLCLPGWGVNRVFFAPLAERLASRHRVVLLDWRGHGESSVPAADFGHAELLEDALAVLDGAGIEAVVPIAQAHGAWIALALARRLGPRVRGIVATSWLVLEPPPAFSGALEALEDPARWQQARDQLLAVWTAGAPAEVVARVQREMGAYGFEMWARAARSIAVEYTRHGYPLRALSALEPPARFLHLFSQPRAPEYLAAQTRFAEENPWFDVERLDAASHFPALEAPDATAAAIARFVAKLPSA